MPIHQVVSKCYEKTTFYETINIASKRAGEGDRPEFLVIPLALEFLCLKDMGITELKAADLKANTPCELSDKRFLIHAVAFGEGITVKEDIPCHGHSVQ
jgi:hypothetical protein